MFSPLLYGGSGRPRRVVVNQVQTSDRLVLLASYKGSQTPFLQSLQIQKRKEESGELLVLEVQRVVWGGKENIKEAKKQKYLLES